MNEQQEEKIECKICGKEFLSFISLGKHLKIHKENPQNYYDKFYKKNENLCIVCLENNTRFISIEKGYSNYCSSSCSNKSELTKNKCVDTWIQKYGTDNPFQLKEIKDKRLKTIFKK